jgi:hypothetical protein
MKILEDKKPAQSRIKIIKKQGKKKNCWRELSQTKSYDHLNNFEQ